MSPISATRERRPLGWPSPNFTTTTSAGRSARQPPPTAKTFRLSYRRRSNLGLLTVFWLSKIKKSSPLPSTDRSTCFAELPKIPRPRLTRLDKFNFPSQPQIYFFNSTTSQPIHSALCVLCIAFRPIVFG